MALHRDKGSPPEVSTSGGLRPNRCEAAAPVDGHSLLPGRSLALVVLIITQLRDRCEAAAPVDGHSIIVQMGDGAKLLPPSMATAYYQGDPSPW